MKTKLILLAATAAVSACTTFNTPSKVVQAGCASAATAISVIADNAGKMSQEQLASATVLIDTITPICTAPDATAFNNSTVQTLEVAVRALEAIKGVVK